MAEPRQDHFDAAHYVIKKAGWPPCLHPEHNTDCRVVAGALADFEEKGRDAVRMEAALGGL